MIDIDIPMSLVRADLYDGDNHPLTLNTKAVWITLHTNMQANALEGNFKSPTITELAQHTNLTVGGVSGMLQSLKSAGHLKTKRLKGTEATTFEYVANPLEVIANTLQE